MSRKGSILHLTQSLAAIGKVILNRLTPQRQLRNLLDNPGKDFVEWEFFRDAKCRKWVTLNVTCGLIMGAVTTIIFSKYPVGRAAFVLGSASLMSGLIATGIGVSLMYVLGDLKGRQYQNLMLKHPVLFSFVLVLPQVSLP
ncbi:hypothetical protein P691DRAFT_808876 [Macrolepiota fuliginosa MF-IS2]|uniref:Uncharacterized protein n=1 Tax=Macrolepiota fuliginosa MF-IS2 TaxID=1400762 RepID=A0A9P5XII8_9AGAR|nr:hypothetical protein P691DRAFT_808876 [Macrolepiota fuliginosa MF-IS2]